MRTRTRTSLALADLDALGTSTDVETAGRAFMLSRQQAYDLVKSGQFPCPVLRIGTRWVIPTSGIRRALGVEVPAGGQHKKQEPTADTPG